MKSEGQRVQRVSVACVCCVYAAWDRVPLHSGTFGGETNAEVLLHAHGAMCARPRLYRISALHVACIDAMMHGASGR